MVARAAVLVLLVTSSVFAGDREDCEQRIRTLGQLVLRYAKRHAGRPPARLSDLYYEGYTADLSLFVCPGRRVPIEERERIDALSGYALCPDGQGPEPRPVLRDLTAQNHGGAGVHVFLSDGSVRFEAAGGERPEAQTEVFAAPGARVYLGLRTRPLAVGDPLLAGLPASSAQLVEDVQSGSPAARWGLRAGDVLLAFGGETLGGERALSQLVAERTPGSRVLLTIVREAKPAVCRAALGDLPRLIRGEPSPEGAAAIAEVGEVSIDPAFPADAGRIPCRIPVSAAPPGTNLLVEWTREGEFVAQCVAGVEGATSLTATLVKGKEREFARGSYVVSVRASGALLASAPFVVR